MARELATEEIGWLSLVLCMFKKITIEEAFQIIAPDPDITPQQIRREQDEEMVQLRKQGLTYREIAMIYGSTIDAVYRRIERYEKRNTVLSSGRVELRQEGL